MRRNVTISQKYPQATMQRERSARPLPSERTNEAKQSTQGRMKDNERTPIIGDTIFAAIATIVPPSIDAGFDANLRCCA